NKEEEKMARQGSGQAWGKLVKVNASPGSEILLINRECTVGRKKDCDLSFPANKLVSGNHCKITQDQNSGQVWLEDMSTNGTVINMSKVVKKQTHLLQNGDVIHFVYRKNEPEQSEFSHLSIFRFDCIVASKQMTPIGHVTHLFSVLQTLLMFIRPSGAVTLDSAVSAAAPPVSLRGAAGKEKTEGATTDKMEESLTCIVCQDLLHDCVSLQPCMHTFCAACYSGWMERSSLCPTCRCPVERIHKNHILNNLVEAYLLQHPEKCRSEEELRSMEARNKITQDMLQPKVERSFSDEEGSSDYLFELSDNDSDVSDMSQPYMMCRQCPGYRKELSSALWICEPTQTEGPAKVPGDGPSTSSDTSPAAQEFRCPPQGSHLICSCCLQPMPDRRFEHLPPQVSPQHCMVCQKVYCHVYWGCQRIGCHGCLERFSELNLNDKCLDGVFNGNQYESEVLQNYLTSRGMSWRHMLQEALQDVQQGLYQLSDYRITANSFLCYCCGLRTFRELAYKYREHIPPSDLPDSVTARPNCYWGRNCRTQVKAHHALKFNHVCEQTRFKN
uniref:E3 ubiquitin-protein ligase CHFR n=1 Tax=Sinocyclocheilus anshuiensis TaxID=1608454 RepID=A0A671PWC2_9TELE